MSPRAEDDRAEALVQALEDEGFDVVFGIPGAWPSRSSTRSSTASSATSCRGTSRARCTPPTATRAPPGRSAPASSRADRARPTRSRASRTPTWTRSRWSSSPRRWSDLIGTDAFQESDITGITIPITKHNYLVKDPAELPEVIKEAFHIATTGRPGPGAHRHSRDERAGRADLQAAGVDEPARLQARRPRATPSRSSSRGDGHHEGARPLLYAGGGVLVPPRRRS